MVYLVYGLIVFVLRNSEGRMFENLWSKNVYKLLFSSLKYIGLLISEKSYGKHSESNITVYDLKRVLMQGPIALPKELRSIPKQYHRFV